MIERMRGRFRWLYLGVMAGGLLWTINSAPLALNPTAAINAPITGKRGVEWDRQQAGNTDEFFRRIKLTAAAGVAAVVVCESASLVFRVLRPRR